MSSRETPLLIYQMGSVGSRTVLESLRAHAQGPRSLFHYHRLRGLEEIERKLLRDPAASTRALEYVQASLRFRRRLDTDRGRWNLLTLVRDPVARNLSAFFHDLSHYVPETETRTDVPSRALLEVFLDRFDHRVALDWFEAELRPVFDVDVFSVPFGFDGYQRIDTQRARVLVIRCEDLHAHFAQAMDHWLGLRDVRVVRANSGAARAFGGIYQRFLSEVVVPDAYLQRIYGSRLARHFYSSQELHRYRERWRRSGGTERVGS